MSVPFPHLRAAIVATPWAILPGRLEAIFEVVERRCAGIRLSQEEIAAIKGERLPNGCIVSLAPVEPIIPDVLGYLGAGRQSASPSQRKQVAVINLRGVVSQHAAQVEDVSSGAGVSTERLNQALAQADADPNIVAVLLRVDSPGGAVYGVQETADRIYAMRNTTPVHASIDSMAASAAYWLTSQCATVSISPSAEAGGIGVYCVHQDLSAASDKAGVRFTYVSAGPRKIDGNPHQPLSDQALEGLQASVDSYYDDFLRAVARGRGRPIEQVREGFGQGRVMRAKDCVRVGACDRIETFEQTLRRLTSGMRSAPANLAAEAPDVHVAAQGYVEHDQPTHVVTLQSAMQPLRNYTAQAQEQQGRLFAEAVASAQETATAIVETELGKLRATMDGIVAQLQAMQEQKAPVPAALTSPLMQKCETCGCNMEASSDDANPQAGPSGMGSGDVPTEHPQSSRMEKCPECGKMREPRAARDGTDGGNGAAKQEPDPQAAIAAMEFRRRRHAARRRGLDAMRG